MKHALRLLSAILVSGGLAGWAIAQPTVQAARVQQAPQRIALLIGNWDYDLDGNYTASPLPGHVADLRNPCKDVDMIEKPLRQADFEIIKHCNLKQGSFASELTNLKAKLKNLPKRSLVFVYYAGHGIARNGYTYTIPVAFQWSRDALDKQTSGNQTEFFRTNANDVRSLFAALPQDFDIGVVIALDSCREDPLSESIGYNEAVSMRVPPNMVVQYATTAGDKAADGGDQNGRFANILAAELAKGGDIGDAMARVQAKMWSLYSSGKKDTFAELVPGDAFKSLGPVPLRVAKASVTVASGSTPSPHISSPSLPPAPPPPTPRSSDSPSLPRRSIDVHSETNEDLRAKRVRLDFLWCEGPGEEVRFAYAKELAEKLNAQREQLGLGRIRLKPLSVQVNRQEGYRVHRNIMRYDAFYPGKERKPIPIEINIERQAVIKIAGVIPDAGFMPKPGVGVRGEPTVNYVSAFVCSDTKI